MSKRAPLPLPRAAMRELEFVLDVDLSPEARPRAPSGPAAGAGADSRGRAPPLLFCTQALLRLLYDDEGVFYRRYHAVVSKDDGARVSRWAQLPRDSPPVAGLPPPAPGDLTRSVFFVKRMELPAAITRLLGAASGALRTRALRRSVAAYALVSAARLSARAARRRRERAGGGGGTASARAGRPRERLRDLLSADSEDEGAARSIRRLHCRLGRSQLRTLRRVQGLDKFTTALVTRVEARPGGAAALRTRFRVEASVYGVQRARPIPP